MTNISPTQNLSDEPTLICLRARTSKLEVRDALERANDTASCFALREVMHALADRHQKPRATIERLQTRPEPDPLVEEAARLAIVAN
jgi:hypothetical protein